jgi:hypothetical protein
MGRAYAQFNRMDEAAVRYDTALEYYTGHGSQKKLESHMDALCSFRVWVAAA